MRELYRKYKREIWIGVVVSLVTTVIIKFGDWLTAIAPLVGSSILGTVSNIIYSLAATYADNFLLEFLIFSGLSVLAGTAVLTIRDGINVYKAVINLEKKTKNLSEEKLGEISVEVLTKPKAKENCGNADNIPILVKKGKQLGKHSILLIILIVLMYFLVVFFVTMPMNLQNKFEQDLVKIAPYVEEDEITQLKSDWVCMRSKPEYDAIYITIDKTKEEYSLPK